jgi:hypothetical protein
MTSAVRLPAPPGLSGRNLELEKTGVRRAQPNSDNTRATKPIQPTQGVSGFYELEEPNPADEELELGNVATCQ